MKRTIQSLAFTFTLAAAGLLFSSVANAQGVSSTTTSSSTTTAGMVSELSPDALVVRTETSSAPIRYGFSSSTTYVDETGAPVSRELIRSGVPVTVSYSRIGEQMIADRVVVRRQTTTSGSAPTVIERNTNTTVTQPPVVIEKPVIVEKKVPVYIEKKVPVIVEKRIAPAPMVEEKTTTTTTTTTENDGKRK